MKMTLKAARVNAHLSQRTTAQAIGVSTVTLRSWENDKSFPNVCLFAKLCRLFGVKMEDISLPE